MLRASALLLLGATPASAGLLSAASAAARAALGRRPAAPAAAVADDGLPDTFDSRVHWFGCGLTVLDQGQCGSCWAVAATGVLGDRFCAHKAEFNRPIELPGDGAGGSGALNRAFQYAGNCVRPNDAARDHGCYRKSVFPSPQAVISCGSVAENASLYPLDAGCNGGNSVEAWRFFRLTGAPPMERGGAGGCVPYTSAGCVTPGGDPNNDGCRACAGLLDQCADSGLPPVMYKAASYGMVNRPALPQRDDPAVDRPPSAAVREREANIMREILANGPVLGCIFDYANFGDFYNKYPLGVYNSTDGSDAFGGHCMNIMGWGTDASSGLPYWLLRNSWGSNWGSAGVVRFRRGVDFLGVESDVWAACPAGAANCALTAGVDTSFMDLPAGAPAAAAGSRGGGYWLPQRPSSPMVLAAAAAFVAAASGEAAPGGGGGDGDSVAGWAAAVADAAANADYIASHGVAVTAAASQVASGLRVRLTLAAPADRVAPHPPAAGWADPAAARLLPPHPQPAGRGASLVAAAAAAAAAAAPSSRGCAEGAAACAGQRSAVTVAGRIFCCPPGCGPSCAASASAANGRVVAACSCGAAPAVPLRVDMAWGHDGGLAQHGSALRL